MSGLLARAEVLALHELAALDGNSGTPPELLLAEAGEPLMQLAETFELEAGQIHVIALLFAAALSEPVARAISAHGAGGGTGVPLWLMQRLVPGFDPLWLATTAPFRRFGLVDIEDNPQRIEARLWLREAVLDRLLGSAGVEADVVAHIAPAPILPGGAEAGTTAELAAALSARSADGGSPIVLTGGLEVGAVGAALAEIGLAPYLLHPASLPDDAGTRDLLARYWSRDAALDAAALIIAADPSRSEIAADFADRVVGHVLIAGDIPILGFRRAVRLLSSGGRPAAANLARWARSLGVERSSKLGRNLARVAAQFRLSPGEIDTVAAQAAPAIDMAAEPGDAARVLWHVASRLPAGTPVPGATLVEPRYSWKDIVLPQPVEASLRRIEAHVRHAEIVFDQWGFDAATGGRGRGVAALFSGPSGTGKTMAAEVLATSLDLRLMVLDTSKIISKFVGETSKNIAAAFDQAERTGAVMVWNEGDAIWGSRGGVANATDRHVNAETGDLLQRIEAFRGFTIITTNLKHAIDPAFMRRFRFTIEFPMPGEGERLRLWRQAFPAEAPIEPIEWSALARLALSGGSIRNIALGSAFLAAASSRRIDRDLVLAELAEELRKQNLPVPAIEWGTRQ